LRSDYEGAARIVHALIIDYKILTFAKATLSQHRAERLIWDCCRRVVEGRPQDAQSNEPVRLLRARGERPRGRCAAEQRDELAAHHSITSSARASKVAGTSRRRALAVIRLMTRSNLVGCSTGISAAFAPRKILSTKSAARRCKSGRFGP